MNSEEYAKFWAPARKMVGPIENRALRNPTSLKLAELIGLEYNAHFGFGQPVCLTDGQKRALELIAGPHGATMVKMLEARLKEDANE